MKVFLLPKISKESISNIDSTDLYPRPLNSIGYNYFSVQTRTKFYDLLLTPENVGKRFYYVIEHLIPDVFNYDKNIDTITKQYFKCKMLNVSNSFVKKVNSDYLISELLLFLKSRNGQSVNITKGKLEVRLSVFKIFKI